MSKVNIYLLLTIAVICLLSIKITAGCTSSNVDEYNCSVNCVNKFIEKFPDEVYNATSISITIQESSCEKIQLKMFSQKFPRLRSLYILASVCPFRDLNFDKGLSQLEELIIKHNGNEIADSYTDRVFHEHGETHGNLKSITVSNLCCDHFWKELRAPRLESLQVNCPNLQTSVSGRRMSSSSPSEEAISLLYAPNLVRYETSTRHAPKSSFFLSDLKNLTTIRLHYSISEYVKLPENYLYQLPSLDNVHISGLTPIGKSSACRHLGATKVLSVYVTNTSPNFFQSCPEILTCLHCEGQNSLQSISYSYSMIKDVKEILFVQDSINASNVRYYSIPMNQALQFPRNKRFDKLKHLFYDNQRQTDVRLKDVETILQTCPSLGRFMIRFNSCDKQFIERMTAYVSESDLRRKLAIYCNRVICQMNNEEKNLCETLMDIEINQDNHKTIDIANKCSMAQMKCLSTIPKSFGSRDETSLLVTLILPVVYYLVSSQDLC